MGYETRIEGFEGQNIEVQVSFWSGPKLLVNGEPAPKGSKRGEMLLQRNDGRQVIATWKPQLGGFDVPQLVVDGKATNLVEPLKWYEMVWSGLPLVLIFLGGAIGGACGAVAFVINSKIFRSESDGLLKYLITGVVSFAAVVVYLIAAVLFRMLLNGL